MFHRTHCIKVVFDLRAEKNQMQILNERFWFAEKHFAFDFSDSLCNGAIVTMYNVNQIKQQFAGVI